MKDDNAPSTFLLATFPFRQPFCLPADHNEVIAWSVPQRLRVKEGKEVRAVLLHSCRVLL